MNDISLYEKIPSIEKNFPVKVRLYTEQRSLPAHWHEHTELLFFLDSDCEFNCNGKIVNVKNDELIIVNSNEVHSFIGENSVKHICILLSPSFFADVDFERVLLKTHIQNDDDVKKYVLDMYNAYEKGGSGSDMLIKSHAYGLMAYLVRNYTTERLSVHNYNMRIAQLERLNKILEYISGHYHEPLTTSKLAEIFYLSENYLCRIFKNSIGTSVTSYINNIRIEKAAVLLKNTDELITNIATNVGFCDINYFSRLFKKIKKCTPREYRSGGQQKDFPTFVF